MYSPGDWDASATAMAFDLDWFANPIFGDGDYPTQMKSIVNKNNTIQRLPSFSEKEKESLRGMIKLDLLKINRVSEYNIILVIYLICKTFEYY